MRKTWCAVAGLLLLAGCTSGDGSQRRVTAPICEDLFHAGVEVAAEPLADCLENSFHAIYPCGDGRTAAMVGDADDRNWVLIAGEVPVQLPADLTEAAMLAPCGE